MKCWTITATHTPCDISPEKLMDIKKAYHLNNSLSDN